MARTDAGGDLEADFAVESSDLDFGAEGGTGAAPLEFSNSVGMPLDDGLSFVHSALVGAGVREGLREAVDAREGLRQVLAAARRQVAQLAAAGLELVEQLVSALSLDISVTGGYFPVSEFDPRLEEDYPIVVNSVGNPDLKRSVIHNYDLRAELYPGLSELVAVSAFYKDLVDPIENSLQPTTGNPAVTPVNAQDAFLYGVYCGGTKPGIRCVRKGDWIIGLADAEVGHRATTVAQIGYIACQLGRKLKWDPAAERFDGDDEANKLLCLPPGREPWNVS